jgi:hypothetical protein
MVTLWIDVYPGAHTVFVGFYTLLASTTGRSRLFENKHANSTVVEVVEKVMLQKNGRRRTRCGIRIVLHVSNRPSNLVGPEHMQGIMEATIWKQPYPDEGHAGIPISVLAVNSNMLTVFWPKHNHILQERSLQSWKWLSNADLVHVHRCRATSPST